MAIGLAYANLAIDVFVNVANAYVSACPCSARATAHIVLTHSGVLLYYLLKYRTAFQRA